MKTIQLSEELMVETEGHSSKGNQPKWFYRNNYYKADHMGYEGLAEVLISRLLHKTNLQEFVDYDPIQIEWGYHRRNGCYSKNFLGKTEELIPIEKLYRRFYGKSLAASFVDSRDTKAKIEQTVSFVETVTGLKDFGPYIGAMVELDALFLNEDRHTNNIAVVHDYNKKQYRLCPYFDQGLSLLSDLEGFWMDGDTDKHMLRVTAKPFGPFSAQRDACLNLFGQQLLIDFTMTDVDQCLKELEEYYRPEYIKRVRYVLEKQMNLYFG